jgi:hypothetical protein
VRETVAVRLIVGGGYDLGNPIQPVESLEIQGEGSTPRSRKR